MLRYLGCLNKTVSSFSHMLISTDKTVQEKRKRQDFTFIGSTIKRTKSTKKENNCRIVQRQIMINNGWQPAGFWLQHAGEDTVNLLVPSGVHKRSSILLTRLFLPGRNVTTILYIKAKFLVRYRGGEKQSKFTWILRYSFWEIVLFLNSFVLFENFLLLPHNILTIKLYFISTEAY